MTAARIATALAVVALLVGWGGTGAPLAAVPPARPGPATACGHLAPAPQGGSALAARASFDGATATLRAVAVSVQRQPALGHPVLALSDRAAVWRGAVAPAPSGHSVDLAGLTGAATVPDQLCVARFPGVPSPVVLLGLFSGGAHCCTDVRAWADIGGRWRSASLEVGNPTADLRPLAGGPGLVTADNAFAARFTDFADSGMPVAVWRVTTRRFGGRRALAFDDVTAGQRSLIAADAARWWHLAAADRSDPLGLLAPWAADECSLGDAAGVFTTLQALEAQGRLRGPPGLGSAGWPQGAAYVSALQAFLVRRGYCRSGVAI